MGTTTTTTTIISWSSHAQGTGAGDAVGQMHAGDGHADRGLIKANDAGSGRNAWTIGDGHVAREIGLGGATYGVAITRCLTRFGR